MATNFINWMARIKSNFYLTAEMAQSVGERELRLRGLAPWSVAKECHRQMMLEPDYNYITMAGVREFGIYFTDAMLTVTVETWEYTKHYEGTPGEYYSETTPDLHLSVKHDDSEYYLNKQQLAVVEDYLNKIVKSK